VPENVAPTVTDVVINGAGPSVTPDERRQRSMVTSIVVRFSEPVRFEEGVMSMVLIGRTATDGRPVGSPVSFNFAPSADRTSMTIIFVGEDVVGGSIPDGRYRLDILMSNVIDDSGLSGSGTRSETFHRLFGDADGNGAVDGRDLLQFRRSLGSTEGGTRYRSWFDIDADGDVSPTDLAQARRRYSLRLLD